MRLTAELVRQSPVHLNPVYERELSLRGLKIPAIENLGAAQDQFEALDFSDNEILKLENFPVMGRVTSVILNNNRIRRIASGLGRSLPKLETLVLTNNQLSRLEDLDALQDLPNLQRLSLSKNPVTGHENYRLYVISMLPKLRHLDFAKVPPAERERANAMFAARVEARAKQRRSEGFQDASEASATAEGFEKDASEGSGMLTQQQKKMIMNAIQAAQSLEEINRLEKMLQEGRVSAAELAKLNDTMQLG